MPSVGKALTDRRQSNVPHHPPTTFYAAAFSKPQLAIDDQKIKGATAGAALSALNRYLKNDFRAGLELLEDTHLDAYKALREACQVDDPAYRA